MIDGKTYGFEKRDAEELVDLIGNKDSEFPEIRPRTRRGGAGGAQVIEFQFSDLDYPELLPEYCEDREPVEGASFLVKVSKVRCGGSRPVYGEDAEGYVEVIDDLAITSGRDFRDLPGRSGIAVLLKSPELDEYGNERCDWVIQYVDFHREEFFVRDIIVGASTITIERAKAKVWDYCRLPDEVVVGTKCESDYYYDGGGV